MLAAIGLLLAGRRAPNSFSISSSQVSARAPPSHRRLGIFAANIGVAGHAVGPALPSKNRLGAMRRPFDGTVDVISLGHAIAVMSVAAKAIRKTAKCAAVPTCAGIRAES